MSFQYVVYQTGYTHRLDPTFYTEEDEFRPDIELMISQFAKKDLEVLAVHDFCVYGREHFFTHDEADISVCREIIQWVDNKSGHINCPGYIIIKSINGGIDGLDALHAASILNNLNYCNMYCQNWDHAKFKVNNIDAVYFDIDAESG